jgi:shikimate dehydrogenase
LLTGETRLVGLLGNPVSHSLSPRMQNAAFAARGLDWAYVPLPVEPEDLEAAVSGLTALGFAGANVTIPHKSAIVSFCDELDGVAERAASVNTLVVREGRVLGSSTDGLAVTGAVAAEGARVLLLGAGGAAVAAAVALLDAGAVGVTVAARDSDRAHALAARLLALFPEKEVAAADAWPPQPADSTLLVNATPLCDEPPVEPSAGQAVVDLAYRTGGGPTALVEAARKAGCDPVVDGREVLVRQGAASFERWTGVTAPVDVMRFAISVGEHATTDTKREE